jgi:hypothetical protein
MMEELQSLALNVLFAIVPVAGGIVATYFGQKGIKGFIIKKIIEAAVEKIAATEVSKMKAKTEQETGHYDLNPGQARHAMYLAQQEVKREIAKHDVKLPPIIRPVISVSKAIPSTPVLTQKIETAVQKRKISKRKEMLSGPRRLGKGR